MSIYKNYLPKDPFSPFSQLNIDSRFYKNIMVPVIKSFSKPVQDNGNKHSSEEFSIAMFLNALLGFIPNTGTEILERKLNSLLHNNLEKFIKQTRILPHSSQMNKYARKFSWKKWKAFYSRLMGRF